MPLSLFRHYCYVFFFFFFSCHITCWLLRAADIAIICRCFHWLLMPLLICLRFAAPCSRRYHIDTLLLYYAFTFVICMPIICRWWYYAFHIYARLLHYAITAFAALPLLTLLFRCWCCLLIRRFFFIIRHAAIHIAFSSPRHFYAMLYFSPLMSFRLGHILFVDMRFRWYDGFSRLILPY